MPPKDKTPENIGQEPILETLIYSPAEAFKILKMGIDVFQDDSMPQTTQETDEDGSRYRVLEATNQEPSVRLRWGVTPDQTMTLFDVDIAENEGITKLKIVKTNPANPTVENPPKYKIEYGTTLPKEHDMHAEADVAKTVLERAAEVMKNNLHAEMIAFVSLRRRKK